MVDGKLRDRAGLVAGLREVWTNIDALLTGLEPAGWAAATGCPGWTVQDCVAHMAGVESRMLGRPVPEHEVPANLPHVRGETGRAMELAVDLRRSWTAERVLADFREVTAARLSALASLDEEALAVEVDGLLGRSPLRSVLDLRVFDLWSHEQDIRRALGRPGGLDGPAAAHSRERLVSGVVWKIQERVAPVAGTALVLDVVGHSAAVRSIVFDGTRGRNVAEVPAEPAVGLRLDLTTLAVLGCGRSDDEGARERVEVWGDLALGRRILEDLAFTP